jgi:hypothetical protein
MASKMRALFIILISLSSAKALAGYDNAWYQSEFWSGEYPIGFSVTKRHTIVMARSKMDKDLPRDVECEMPYLAVIHPWNTERIRKNKIRFFSATKIIKMIAKDDFEFGGDVTVKKGQMVEYIGNGAEDFFQVRISGKQYTAGQDLFDFVEAPTRDQFIEDDWLLLTCQTGNRAYIFVPDLAGQGPTRASTFVPGISDTGPGQEGYGRARDLTEQEANTLERERGTATR